MEISLDLAGTGGLDINDLLLKSPQEQKQEVSSEEEWENVDTGEPVSETKVVYLYWMALTCSLHFNRILHGCTSRGTCGICF